LSLARSIEECLANTSTMLRFVLASCLAAAAAGQFVDPASAKILKEQRYNTGAGQFGSAYAQEDGTVSREETINDKGERTGQYSYIGEDGKTYNVKWTAGKDGFRVEGDHIPKGANGLNSAPFNPEEAAPAPVVQAAAPLPKAAPAPKAAPIPQAAPIDYDYVDVPVDPNFNPFINPHDPTHRDFRFNVNGANHQGAGALNQRTSAAVPNCADCAGVNPFINPFDASHNQAGLLAGHLAGAQPAPRRQQQPAPRPQQPIQPAFFAGTTTTPSPRRFFPPGQLNLNRFETGFNFDFTSQ